MANIIITTVGTAGDVLPLVQIGKRLTSRGHAVTLVTHVSYAGLAADAGLDFAALDNADEYARSIADGPLLNTPRCVPEYLRRHCFPLVPRECELIRQRYRPDETLLIARDLFDVGARIAAEKLNIPLRWTFVAPIQLQNRQLRLELLTRILADDVHRLRERLDLPRLVESRAWWGYPGCSLGIWPDWFAPPDPMWPAEVVPVGFVLDNEGESGALPDELKTILDGAERPILITGGTGTFAGARFYSACAQACGQMNRRGILVTPHDELVPSDLPDSIRRYRFLPLGKLMPHLDAVLHHGGRGTCACALVSGTPQVVLAWGADRPDNASRLERLGVAKYLPLPDWKPAIVAEAVQRLTGSPAVRERCRELSRCVSGTDALSAACQVIEGALPHGVRCG